MNLLTTLVIGVILWPFEALMVMCGFRLLVNQGFDLPAPGYWSSFMVALGISLIYNAASVSSKLTED